MTGSNPAVPAIPAWLADMDTVGGLVVPWLTPRTDDGRYLFGVVDSDRVRLALQRQWCGVCGRPLDADRLVLLVRWSDLAWRRSFEPGLHPVCANYATIACPMVAGRLDHYRSTPPLLDAGMLSAQDSVFRRGDRAEPWFSVWLPGYRMVIDHGKPAASYEGIHPRRIRPIGAMAALASVLGLVPDAGADDSNNEPKPPR